MKTKAHAWTKPTLNLWRKIKRKGKEEREKRKREKQNENEGVRDLNRKIFCFHVSSNDYQTNCVTSCFIPFMEQHVIDKKSTSSQAHCGARPSFETCKRVPALTKRLPYPKKKTKADVRCI